MGADIMYNLPPPTSECYLDSLCNSVEIEKLDQVYPNDDVGSKLSAPLVFSQYFISSASPFQIHVVSFNLFDIIYECLVDVLV